MAKVTRLPPVTSVCPTESVSATIGFTSSTGIPNVSANCMAIEVRVPPMSVEPSSSVTLPSLFSLASTLEVKPMLNQNPEAMPRPRFLPGAVSSGVCHWAESRAACMHSMWPMRA